MWRSLRFLSQSQLPGLELFPSYLGWDTHLPAGMAQSPASQRRRCRGQGSGQGLRTHQEGQQAPPKLAHRPPRGSPPRSSWWGWKGTGEVTGPFSKPRTPLAGQPLPFPILPILGGGGSCPSPLTRTRPREAEGGTKRITIGPTCRHRAPEAWGAPVRLVGPAG